MACVAFLEMRVKQDHIEAAMKGFKDLFPDTRSFDECLDVYATRDQDDPNTFMIVETWENRQKYEAYYAWRAENGDIETLRNRLEGDLNLRFFDLIGA